MPAKISPNTFAASVFLCALAVAPGLLAAVATDPGQARVQALQAQVDNLDQQLLQLHNATDDASKQRLMQDYWAMLLKQLQYLRHLPGVETHDCKDWTMLDPGVIGRAATGSNTPCPLMGHDLASATGWPLPQGMTPKLFEFMMNQQLQVLRAETSDIATEPDAGKRMGLLRELYETRYRDIQTVRGRDWMWTPHDLASLPDGHTLGAELLGRYCSQCHAAPLPGMYTQGEWQGITYYMRDMISMHKGERVSGIQMPTPEEFDLIENYLESHAHTLALAPGASTGGG
jgi:hypothetical protein